MADELDVGTGAQLCLDLGRRGQQWPVNDLIVNKCTFLVLKNVGFGFLLCMCHDFLSPSWGQ